MEFNRREGQITKIVAEVGNTHDGSLGNAHAFIDAAADAGADAVKFQYHLAAAESSTGERFPRRFHFHPQDETRQAYWERMEFSQGQWANLAEAAHSRGVEFGVSVFSIEAVHAADCVPLDFIKIPSGEIGNHALIDAVRRTGLPVVLSTGFATEMEIDKAVATLDMLDRPRESLIVLQCTTEYPTPAEHVGLNLAEEYARHLPFMGGLSDHSGTIWPAFAAAVLGCQMVEVHVCWDKRQFGCDVESSITVDELEILCDGIRFIEQCKASPVDKDAAAERLKRDGDVSAYVDGKTRLEYDFINARMST